LDFLSKGRGGGGYKKWRGERNKHFGQTMHFRLFSLPKMKLNVNIQFFRLSNIRFQNEYPAGAN
jgi:hypothetical protein